MGPLIGAQLCDVCDHLWRVKGRVEGMEDKATVGVERVTSRMI